MKNIFKKIWSGIIKIVRKIILFIKKIISGIYVGPRAKKIILWTIIVIAGVIQIATIVFSLGIYGKTWQNKPTYQIIRFYPYPAAIVGTDFVSVKTVWQQMLFLKNYGQKAGQQLPPDKELRSKIIAQEIDDILIRKQVLRNGLKVSQKEVNEVFDKIASEQGGRDIIIKVLKEYYGMSENDFKKIIKSQLYRNKVKTELLAQVKVRHILIKDENRAKEILERVKKGENFEDLAKQYSEDVASRDKGGDLGFIGEDAPLLPDFKKAALALEPGKVTQDLVKTDFGYHIIKVDEKKGKISKSAAEWLKDLKKRSLIITLIRK